MMKYCYDETCFLRYFLIVLEEIAFYMAARVPYSSTAAGGR